MNETSETVIPFNRPYFVGKESDYIRQAIQNGHTCGNGPFTKKCNSLLEAVLRVPKVLLTTSCTHALEMCALLLNIQPGDEVIVPPFTFVSTVNAFVLRGARPVFCDIRPDTLNLDEGQLERHINKQTKAIVPVHYAGVGCEMRCIMEMATKYNIPVIEDNAHGLFGKYRGKPLGTFGCLATQSFHETKNFNCGEGGALIINDARFAERAEILLEKGTDRSRFFRGQVDKYSWVDVGSSYLPSEMLAAYLYAQLEVLDDIQARRSRIWSHYNTQLAQWAASIGASLPHVPEDCDQAFHMFYILMPDLNSRQRIIKHLREQRIVAVFHYVPLHLSEMGKTFARGEERCPVTESISDRLVRLPFYNSLTEEELFRVTDSVQRFQLS